MSDEKTLVPVEQRTVEFYGDALTAVRGDDGQVYVVISHLCDALGIDTQGQTRRIQRQPVLADGYTWVDILSTQPVEQRRKVQVLRVDLVPLWLTGVSTRSIKDAGTRAKLLRFQQEAARVLWAAFQEGQLTSDPDLNQLLAQADNEAVQAYQMLQAMVKLARNQILMEARLTGRLDDHQQRLEQIEIVLGDPGRQVTPAQASQLSQAVKAVALELGKQTGRNEYGGVYGELYRKFDITGYKLLPAARFKEAIDWLGEWYRTLTNKDELPF